MSINSTIESGNEIFKRAAIFEEQNLFYPPKLESFVFQQDNAQPHNSDDR